MSNPSDDMTKAIRAKLELLARDLDRDLSQFCERERKLTASRAERIERRYDALRVLAEDLDQRARTAIAEADEVSGDDRARLLGMADGLRVAVHAIRGLR